MSRERQYPLCRRHNNCVRSRRFAVKRKKPTTRVGAEPGYSFCFAKTKIFRFAFGERAPRRLSLKCEPISCLWQEAGLGYGSVVKRKNRPRGSVLSFGCGTRIRTQTNRVRVCSATVTQFRIFARVYSITRFLFCQVFFLFFSLYRKLYAFCLTNCFFSV